MTIQTPREAAEVLLQRLDLAFPNAKRETRLDVVAAAIEVERGALLAEDEATVKALADAPKRWKIVAHDNYDRETVNEWLVCENFRNEETANLVCDFLNQSRRFLDSWWLRVIPQDKALYRVEP